MVTCAGCQKDIGNEAKVTSGEDVFHSNCFKCGACQCHLAGVSYYTIEEKKICKDCYGDKFAAACSVCNNKVIGQATKLGDGRSFHPECFKCASCDKPIVSSFRTDDAGKFHHTPNCEEAGASDDDKCKECDRQLVNVKYFTLAGGEKACADCYQEKHSAKCYKCQQPILEGQSHIVKDWKFHADCFKCPTCEKHLGGRKIKLQGGDTVVCFSCSEP
jgi:hypothetical protein